MPFECPDDIMGRRIKKGNSKAGDDCGQRKNCDKGDERCVQDQGRGIRIACRDVRWRVKGVVMFFGSWITASVDGDYGWNLETGIETNRESKVYSAVGSDNCVDGNDVDDCTAWAFRSKPQRPVDFTLLFLCLKAKQGVETDMAFHGD
jgi:hypothetical protein